MENIWQTNEFISVKSRLNGRTIYVNQSPNQYLISPKWSRGKIAACVKKWRTRWHANDEFSKDINRLTECKSPNDFGMALQVVLFTKYPQYAIPPGQASLVDLLIAFWSKGIIAWPAGGYLPFHKPTIMVSNPAFGPEQTELILSLIPYFNSSKSKGNEHLRFFMANVLSRAGIRGILDFTPETFFFDKSLYSGKPHPIAYSAILKRLKELEPSKTFDWTLDDFGFYTTPKGPRQRDSEFEWVLSADPTLEQWVMLAKEHLRRNTSNFKKRKSSVNVFMQYLLDAPSVPRNPISYFDARNVPKVLFDRPGNKGRQTMSVIHEFLNEVLFQLCTESDDFEHPVLMPGFANPIRRTVHRNVNGRDTHRKVMPTKFMKLAFHILTDDDYAWVRGLERRRDNFPWYNPESGEIESVFCPATVYALHAKLLLPARTHQIRFLDSGEGDTERYASNGTWAKNTNSLKLSEKGQIRRGVFRKYTRKDGSKGSIIYFNTNKTADIGAKERGYEMCWEKHDALELFTKMRDWQEKYNPVTRPTAWSDIKELRSVTHAKDLADRGNNYFLFRDAANPQRPDLPVTDGKIRSLWLSLMGELERRLDVAGMTYGGEKIVLIKSYDKDGRPSSAEYDLHTLRVSMITALYEEGVPAETIMKIVGHETVLMTLHYVKLDVGRVSEQLDEALLARYRKEQWEWAGIMSKASRQTLERATAHRYTAALDAMASTNGKSMVVMDHGLCPVGAARCREGLIASDPGAKRILFAPVPGGPGNCVRCRFFISGPAFLFGLEAKVVDLTYRLKKASFSFEEAQIRFDEISDECAVAMEEQTPFLRQRELDIAESALEASTTAVDDITLSLQAAYVLTEQCIRINNELVKSGRRISNTQLALVVSGGTHELEAVLHETHEFEQLQRLCNDAVIFDGLQIDWRRPNLERARLFDRMLRQSGFEPRFFNLTDKDALGIANEMGKFLYSRLQPKEVHDLVDGATSLQALGLDKTFMNKLETMTPKVIGAKAPRVFELAN